MQFGSTKGRYLLKALQKAGWVIRNGNGGSHLVLQRSGFPNYVFSFNPNEEVGHRMLAKIAKVTGLTPDLL